ncbi:molybdate ABC transporter, periplasmic molybdate-binding protein [Roseibium sp. TrichSKD4]|uniref:molybdate ABC transporter substrate-binding protein n=1 Tax=Roseibium sp. TrichSKD4 TaxID=744980 RepID=UPI0001E567E4|nr:molybdate ABC transporter substrate-binding protein [Roseibium sp. TrichSKD4]EFO30527.1 molybdate ABC transporter, periplasmic molybdate-binding protein [Roseibium sp. TrichSKD4]
MQIIRKGRRFGSRLILLLGAFLMSFNALGQMAATARVESVTVFAAASLKNVLEDLAGTFEKRTGYQIVLSFAGSSALARQIEYGAPADIFISANRDWMDQLESGRYLEPDSRFNFAGNRLALIRAGAPSDTNPAEITSKFDLAGALDGGQLAMALVEAVPAGIYGKAALEHLGLWQGVQGQVAQSNNVRSAMALVALGAASLGIVYETDAAVEPNVTVLGRFPQDSHPPILYPAAVVDGRGSKAAKDFMSYLQSLEAQALLKAHGFLTVAGAVGG